MSAVFTRVFFFSPKGQVHSRMISWPDVHCSPSFSKHSWLVERKKMQQQRDYEAADEIRSRLAADFNVRLDDRNMQWHLDSQDYVQVPSVHNFDEDTLAFIQDQVNQRTQARIEKDYKKADAIRDSLIDEFSVVIEDRVKGMVVLYFFLKY